MPRSSGQSADPRTDASTADPRTERWLRDEVAPVFDAMQADPGRARSVQDVFGEIRARHARALAGRS